jgi:hypothetical protein
VDLESALIRWVAFGGRGFIRRGLQYFVPQGVEHTGQGPSFFLALLFIT